MAAVAWRPGTVVLVLVLVLANLLYFAWSRGAFEAFGFLPASFTETEPHRLARQIRPELLRIGQEATSIPGPISGSGSGAEGEAGR